MQNPMHDTEQALDPLMFPRARSTCRVTNAPSWPQGVQVC